VGVGINELKGEPKDVGVLKTAKLTNTRLAETTYSRGRWWIWNTNAEFSR
jgi:hypothetical protein